MTLSEMNKEQLSAFQQETLARYNDFKAQGLCLNMSRGNPCKEQLELSVDMLDVFDDGDFMCENGIDVRNYGLLDGIPEAKKLFSDMIGVGDDEVIIFGNSSLNAMFWAVQPLSTRVSSEALPGASWIKSSSFALFPVMTDTSR